MKAIAIDDEPFALEVIKNLAEEVSFIELTKVFTRGIEAVNFLQKNPVDLIFLDIKMPGISGLELLKTIPAPPLIVFTTAYSEHAVTSFEWDAVDYLLKPFSLIRFLKACNKANELHNLRSNVQLNNASLPAIFIKSGYEQVRVELSDILYAESVSNYIRFVTNNQTIVSRLTMSEVELILPANAFIRIHRSFIISKKHIAKMDKRSIWVLQKELPIGEAYRDQIQKLTRKQ